MSLGFQLVIEVISAHVNVLMGLDLFVVICSADWDGGGVEESGKGSPCQVQSCVDSCLSAGL